MVILNRKRSFGILLCLLCVLTISLLRLDYDISEQVEKSVPRDSEVSDYSFKDWLNESNKLNHIDKPTDFLDIGIELAQIRAHEMRHLIKKNPRRALDEAISREEWNTLPDEIKPYIEEPIYGIADVDVSIECGENTSKITTFTKLKNGAGFLSFTTPGNRFNRTRKNVEIEGIRLGDLGALRNYYEPESESTSPQMSSGSSDTWNMYVVLVNFSDWNSWFIDNAVIEDDINTTVSQMITEMSFGQLSVNCTVHPGVFEMPNSMADYLSLPYGAEPQLTVMMNAMHEDINSPTDGIGVDLSSYDTVCIVSKQHPQLVSFAGYANIAGPKMWIQVYSPGYTPTNTIVHELGHNFGSYHAHFWNVPGPDPIEEEPPGENYHVEYGDTTDIMGRGLIPQGHFHVQNKHRVGWLDEFNVQDISESGTYRIFRSDNPNTSGVLKALRIHKSYDSTYEAYHYYWVGYKQQYPEYENFGRGLYLLWQKANSGGFPKSHLIDMTAGSTGGVTDSALALGKTYSDTAAEVHITPVARGGTEPDEYVDVVVNLGTFTNNPPTASINTSGDVTGEESVMVSVTASDDNGDDLAYFWDFGDGKVYPNAPAVRHVFSGSGPKTVKCTVSDMKGGTTTAEAVLNVVNPLDNWTELISITTADINDVTYGNGKFVAVGSMGIVATSTDAETWTEGDIGGTEPYLVILEAIIFDGSKFIAVGNHPTADYSDFVGAVYRSSDGVTWTKDYSTTNADIQLRDISYNGSSTYLAVGDNGYYLHSTNGISWTTYWRLDGDANHLDAHMTGIGFINGAFPVVGIDQPGTIDGPMASVSFSGSVWYIRDDYANASSGFSSLEICNGSVFASGQYFGIRRSINRGYNYDIVYDGSYEISAFAYGNGIYFGAGHDSSDNDKNVVSNNGVDWHELTTPTQENRNTAFFFNNRFYTLGNKGALWKSDPVSNADSGWAKWQNVFSLELGINRDAGEDEDKDGVENLIEYALGTDPGDPSSVPVVTASKDGSGYLNIFIPRYQTAPDLEYIVEQSTGLGDGAVWSDVETAIVSETETELVVRTTQTMNDVSPQFLRLRVEFASP